MDRNYHESPEGGSFNSPMPQATAAPPQKQLSQPPTLSAAALGHQVKQNKTFEEAIVQTDGQRYVVRQQKKIYNTRPNIRDTNSVSPIFLTT